METTENSGEPIENTDPVENPDKIEIARLSSIITNQTNEISELNARLTASQQHYESVINRLKDENTKEKQSNVELFVIPCVSNAYSVALNENLIFEIVSDENSSQKAASMISCLETLSISNDQQELTEKDNSSRSIREKSSTPTNNITRSDINNLMSRIDQKLDKLSNDVTEKINDVTEKLDKLSNDVTEKINDVTEKINLLSNDLSMLYQLVQPMIGKAIDPWDITARSQGSSDPSLSKHEINHFYNLRENECMVCGYSRNVVNAHIWPKHTKGKHLLSMFNLTNEQLNDPRNYLRLCKSLEVAFDNKQITIIEKNRNLLIYVLDASIKGQQVSGTIYKFKDCHMWPLNFKNANRPFLRILAAHCRNAFIDAFRLKQINHEVYKMGYRSSVRLLNASPDGPQAKIFDWFERNHRMVKYQQN